MLVGNSGRETFNQKYEFIFETYLYVHYEYVHYDYKIIETIINYINPYHPKHYKNTKIYTMNIAITDNFVQVCL